MTAIQEAKDLTVLTIEQLIGSLMTHEMLVESKAETTAKNKELVLKAEESDESGDEISLMARRFEKHLRIKAKGKFAKDKNHASQTRRTSSNYGCFKCGEMGHKIKNYPTWKKSKGEPEEKKVFKKAMMAAVWGDSESDEESEEDQANLCLTTCIDEDQLESSSDMLCLMAGSCSSDENQVSFDSIKENMHNFDKNELLECLEFSIDQCISVGSAYQSNKRKLKTTNRDLQISEAKLAEAELICKDLREKIFELEITIDQHKMDLEMLNSRSLPSEQELFNKIDKGFNDLKSFILNNTSLELLKGACTLSKIDVILAYDHLIDDIENLRKEHAILKTTDETGSLSAINVDIDILHGECTNKIFDLETELAKLKKEVNEKNTQEPDPNLVSNLQDELDQTKIILDFFETQNTVQLEEIETKDFELAECMKQLNKMLDAQNTLDNLISQPGNSQRFGLGYSGTSSGTSYRGKSGHVVQNCWTKSKHDKRNKSHVK